jgi:AcrR family transcriptional regulator
MPRPPLTRSRIVAAGLDIASELGLPALSVRAVARRVNATATGVQRHIGTTELVEAVVAEIVGSMPAVPEQGDWSRRVRQWAIRTRAWLTGYPGLARHLLANRWETFTALDRLEDVVGVLGASDLTKAEQVRAASTLYWFVLGSTDLDESAGIIGSDLSMKRIVDAPERWPRLSVHGGDHSPAAAQAQFLFGLDLLLGGIGRRAPKGADLHSANAAAVS